MIARPRRIGIMLAAVLAVGCGLVSGASDLEVVDTDAKPGLADATSEVTPSTPDGAARDSGADVSVDAKLPASRLREVTFESGMVEVPGGDGVDDLDGQAVNQSTTALKGSRSLTLERGRVTVAWPEQGEVWVRWISLRKGAVAAPLAQLGPLTIDMVAAGTDRAQVRVRIGNTVAATSPALKVANVPLHVGLHLKKGMTNGIIEVWADAGPGQSAQLGAPFLSQSTAAVTFPLTEVVIETLDGTETVLDDIRVDNVSMPP